MRVFIKKIEKGEVRRLALNAWKRMETHGNARKRTGARHSADGGSSG